MQFRDGDDEIEKALAELGHQGLGVSVPTALVPPPGPPALYPSPSTPLSAQQLQRSISWDHFYLAGMCSVFPCVAEAFRAVLSDT
jgi:hypothetical protein